MDTATHFGEAGPQQPPQTTTEPTEPPKLTTKQKLFVEYYLADPNGVKAARNAGYSGDDNALAVVAHDNLSKSKIKYYLQKRIEEAVMSADDVLKELGKIASMDYFLAKGDKLKALELIGKYHKLYTDRKEHTGAGGGPIGVRVIMPEMPQEEPEEE